MIDTDSYSPRNLIGLASVCSLSTSFVLLVLFYSLSDDLTLPFLFVSLWSAAAHFLAALVEATTTIELK
ncbi:MAG: hypothetical protein ACK4S4_00670 [Pyrinomonadaceae bacterium]